MDLCWPFEQRLTANTWCVYWVVPSVSQALVIVVETFSDVELLCDILEACTKRRVCVYLLLDRLNLQQFLDMCVELNVDGKHFPVRGHSPFPFPASLCFLSLSLLFNVNHPSAAAVPNTFDSN